MKWFKSLSEPMKVAVITGIFGIIAAVVGSLVAGIFAFTSASASKIPNQGTNAPIVTVQTTPSPRVPQQPTAPTTLSPTPTPISDPYPPYTGTVALNDPLSDNSQGTQWDEGSTTYGNCTFQQDHTYHVFAIPNYYHRCAAEKTGFHNFAFQISFTIVRGDCGGMIFRADAQSLNYYYFTICENGTYTVAIYTNGSEKPLQNAISSPAIHTALGQGNTIGVVASNTTLSFYANTTAQAIYTTSDSTFSQGQIGLVAESDGNTPADVSFSHAIVWVLS